MRVVFGSAPEVFDLIASLEEQAAQEGVTMKNPDGTDWFVALDGDQVLGFMANVYTARTIRLKSGYVLPEFRQQGVFSLLLSVACEVARQRAAEDGQKYLIGYCLPPSLPIMIRRGFKPRRGPTPKSDHGSVTLVYKKLG